MGGSFQDDGSAASSAKSFDVVSRLQAGVKASKGRGRGLALPNEILVEEPAKFAPNESDSDDTKLVFLQAVCLCRLLAMYLLTRLNRAAHAAGSFLVSYSTLANFPARWFDRWL